MRYLIAAVALLASTAHATLITIEPDDYAEGTDLRSVSPFVSINALVTRTAYPEFFPAITGSLGFGMHGLAQNAHDLSQDGLLGGLLIQFHQAVTQVEIMAQSIGYCVKDDGSLVSNPTAVSTTWVTYDRDGGKTGQGSVGSAGCGIPYAVSVRSNAGLWAIALGASDSSAVVEYDDLMFETMSVPEPSTFWLMALGLLVTGIKLREAI